MMSRGRGRTDSRKISRPSLLTRRGRPSSRAAAKMSGPTATGAPALPGPGPGSPAPGSARGSTFAVLARGYKARASGEPKARPLTPAYALASNDSASARGAEALPTPINRRSTETKSPWPGTMREARQPGRRFLKPSSARSNTARSPPTPGSMRTRAEPPQIAPSTSAGSASSLKDASRAFPSRKASPAIASTRASSSPPPTVPASSPAAENMADAPGTWGVEPSVSTTVAKTSPRPSVRISMSLGKL